ncbi:MAG TPA: RNA methyltransferase [Geobacteraceae bacterium]|nr:RNA methyltransferase [Geobacteraceae bacterium]
MTDGAQTGANVSIALLHYPVYDKNRQVVATAVTNLDIHDIARAAKTFGLFRYYVVTPVAEQRELAERIGRHWREGWGATYNPKRRAALELMRVLPTLDDALADLEEEFGRPVKLVVTGALGRPNSISSAELAQQLKEPAQSYLLLFGTGWGLTEEVFARADLVLEPIRGPGDYNHLSVRSAAAIVLDRLLGVRR